ncbi:MAG: thioredoxin [Candidatus Doudnabacteria bacterium RIFCSPHIGHO2_02_FULL_48_21]|uniref:Thioredoxin n=1 Tax=Candidatus Doudnabacteria bacterium RIFCSPLOWO2_02_FULL_48_13 TaxID=1817845 RepID=A0A1F5Q994_9BACT|nr:MAG: thioredoxin [Candidatus Doudnabacteria bacterium RIFCSPHIGHO2_01_48_18]OGE79569.1 MAG: thioredoxin [Candidatus Doudnabacteria bacterium RIFCSPHIGHO2_01_FULL_48_180]OGE91096.1 MAG: thioredoxin [Candidatus Doudnabacteria bacterium RIFCSPHIGHO2_12_FULL_47_25]OGE93786.1 MAG: thioredoxin [Candidatus Doudnabacteria bacterium RIFCSPHIGHO2_02_FULL_48_21]OGE97972.1 MAG: thioredoxin [Candidatus Doudnabacteria bacterium RIFCSPLOWO2_01_FULL_48_57]OGE98686.1 MAG: thioredoxin [Candidatus Doudnabacte
METTLNKNNFSQEVLNSPTPVLVDFWAEWCVPCKLIAPALAEISEEYKDKIKIAKLNVDDFPEIAMQYHVRGIPNMKIFKNGQIADEIVGAVPKAEIVKRLQKQI